MLQNARQQSVASSIAIGKSRRDVEKTDSLTDMDRTDHSLVALRRILRATELYGRDLAQEAGLTAVQLRVLQIIGETDHSTPSEIATRMGVSQATISVLLNKLEGYGLIARQKSRADRRQTDLQITAKGRAKVEVAPDALQQRYVAQFEALPDWEQSMIVSVLERVAGMLDAGTIDAAPVLTGGELLRNGRGWPRPSVVLFEKDAEAGVAVGADGAPRRDLRRDVEVEVDVGAAFGIHRHVGVEVFPDILAEAQLGRSVGGGLNVEVVKSDTGAQAIDDPGATSADERVHCRRDPHRLEGRDLGHIPPEQQQRQHFFLGAVGA